MRFNRSRTLATIAVASISLMGLAACGSDDDDAKEPETTQTSDAPTDTESSEPAASADGQPEWAAPVTTGGDLISTIEVGDIKVEVYQVGVTKATKTGQFVDPDKNEPIIDKGDDIVFVNYVVSNSGDPIDLGSSLVNVEARYDDWPYMQGMDSIVDSALFEEQGVNDDGFADGSYVDPSIYTLGKGEQYSYGENFRYQKDSPITFDVTITPVDDKGDLIHDKRAEGEGTGKIK